MSPAIDATDINLNGDALGINPANPGQPPSAMAPGGGSPLAAGYMGKMDALNADMQGEFSAQQREQSPYRQKLQQVLDSPNAAAAHLEKAKAEPKPEDYRKHTMEFATGMALMGALAGRFTRMSGQTALAAFGGAMKGWQEGNLQAYETAAKEWDQATKKTLENNKIELEKYKAVMADKALNIDQLMASMNLIATEHQNKIMFDSTMAKNYTMALGAVDKLEAAHTKLENGTAKLNEIRTKQRSETVAAVEDLLAHPEKTAQMSLKDYQKLKGDAAVLGLNVPDQTESKGSQPRSMPGIYIEQFKKDFIAKNGRQPTAEEIAGAAGRYTGGVTEERAVGNRAGAIAIAVDEAHQTIPQVLQAAEKSAGKGLASWNKIENRWKVEKGDEEFARYTALLNSLVNVYGRAISGGGKGTVSDLEHAREMLNPNMPLSAVRGSLSGMSVEIENAARAPGNVRTNMRGGGEDASPVGGGALPPGNYTWSPDKGVH